MKSILEELWYGNLCPEIVVGKMRGDEKKLAGYIAVHHEKLISMLNDEQKEILEKFTDCRDELSMMNEKTIFINAFCLGARIAFEVMSKDFE